VQLVDVLVIVLFTASVLAFAFWAERRMERQEKLDSMERHPSGHYCDECAMRVEDWETHLRLAHSPRIRAPEDSW
jgi:hypothetical protein